MSNEKLMVQRPFAVQSSTTCCGFSTANGKLWASEPLSSGSVHEILWLWLDNSVCACLCIGFPWLFQWCEFPKELSSRDGSIEVIVKWQDGEASRTGISPRPHLESWLLWQWMLRGEKPLIPWLGPVYVTGGDHFEKGFFVIVTSHT